MFLITASGRKIDPANPRPDDICLEDIASGLSKEERFDGNTFEPYTVAQHTCLVADLVASGAFGVVVEPQVKAALLHDASEAYIGDVVQPLKRLLPDYARIEALWNEAIFTRFGLDPSWAHDSVVKAADRLAFQCECCRLVPNPEDYEMTREQACSRFGFALEHTKSVWDLSPGRTYGRRAAKAHFLRSANFLGIN